MAQTNTARKKETRKTDAPYVVVPQEDGFHVYASDRPREIHVVSREPDGHITCTCEAFERSGGQDCAHINAAYGRFAGNGNGSPMEPEDIPHGFLDAHEEAPPLRGTQMTLKRSVSPDGRIDSLSVEFSVPADGMGGEELEGVAMSLLERQHAIVDSFRDRQDAPSPPPQRQNGKYNGRHNGNGRAHGNDALVEATLRDVGGLNTRYGWRYTINVECGREMYKLMGTRKQLAEQLSQAGYEDLASRFQKGDFLDVPCLAQLVKSRDGRYTNVEAIFPCRNQRQARR